MPLEAATPCGATEVRAHCVDNARKIKSPGHPTECLKGHHDANRRGLAHPLGTENLRSILRL